MRPTTESGRGGRERVAERSHLPFACSHPYPWKQGDARRPIPARSRRRRGRRADRPCWKGRSRGGSCRWRGARRSRDWPVSRSRRAGRGGGRAAARRPAARSSRSPRASSGPGSRRGGSASVHRRRRGRTPPPRAGSRGSARRARTRPGHARPSAPSSSRSKTRGAFSLESR